MLDNGKLKSFLIPDSRRILLFLAIPFCLVALLFSGPSLFPEGSSADIVFVIPQILLGTFLALVTAPFTIVAMIFRAFGFDPFYATGMIAEMSVILGIAASVFWWYVISGLVICSCSRLKRAYTRRKRCNI